MAILKTVSMSLLTAVLMPMAFAQGKGSATTTLDLAADARLAKNISIDEPVITLGGLVQKISEQSKVKISVNKPLAESRICLVATEQPLGKTLEKIAGTFGYTWEVSGEQEARVYNLAQTNQDRASQQQEIKKARDLSIELLREALQAIEGALQKGDYESFRKQMEELPPLPETTRDPKEAREILRRYALSYISHWEAWIAAGTLLRLSPPDWYRLQQGYPLVFSSAASGTPVPNNALAFWKKETMRQHEQTREIMSRNSPITIPSPPGGVERPMSMEDIMRQQEEKTLGVKELRVHLRYDTETGQVRYHLEVPSEGSQRRETVAIAVSADMRGGSRLMTTRNLLNPADWQLAEKQREIMGKKETKLPESFATAKVEADKRAKEDYFNQHAYELAAKARAAKSPLIMEWYPLYPPAESSLLMFRLPGSGEPNYLSENGYEIISEDGWTIIRHTARAFSRRDDVAQTNIQRWLYETEGRPNLDIVSEMAFLTSPQLAGLLNHAGRQMTPSFTTSGGASEARVVAIPGMGLGALRKLIEDPGLKYALRLYGQLSPLQKQKIAQGETLPYSTMTAAQQKTYLETVALLTRAPYEAVQAALRDGNTALEAGFSLNAAGVAREVSRFSFGDGDNPISMDLNMDTVRFNLRWRGEELNTDMLILPKPEPKAKRAT